MTGDALYQQYKQQAVENGRLAMMDTMGQAAALNGGYGSSYGQAVGQQAYNEYLRGLNDVVPELYNAAYQRYSDEGDRLYQQYQMLRDQENQDYSRWNDDYNRRQQEIQNARAAYESERDFDYATQMTEREYWQGRAEAEQNDYWKVYAAEQAAAAAAAKGSGGSGGGGGGGGKKGKTPTDAMWNKAKKALTFYEMEDLVADWQQKGYNTDAIEQFWDDNNYGALTTRADSVGGNPSDDLKTGLQNEATDWINNTGDMSISYNALKAEQSAADEVRRYLSPEAFRAYMEEEDRRNPKKKNTSR